MTENFRDMEWLELKSFAADHDVNPNQKREQIESQLEDKLASSDGGNDDKDDSNSQNSANDDIEEDVSEDVEDLSSEDADEPTIGFDDIIDDESSKGSEDSEDKAKRNTTVKGSDEVDVDVDSRTGRSQAINKLWARAFVIDKDPESDDAENIRKNIQAVAEDVDLGENINWYLEEELNLNENQSPKQAMFTSLVMAGLFSLAFRDDIAKKMYDKISEGVNSSQDEDKSDEEDNDEEEEG